MQPEDMLKSLFTSSGFDAEKLLPIEEQKEVLLALATKPLPEFKVGQLIQRNELGIDRYKFPMKGQVGVITNVFDEVVLEEDDKILHGEMACLFKKGSVRFYTVDFRYFKPHLMSAG